MTALAARVFTASRPSEPGPSAMSNHLAFHTTMCLSILISAFLLGGCLNVSGDIDNVSAPENGFVPNLSVFPNPAGSYAELKFTVEKAANTQFTICDLAGREVYRQEAFVNAGFNNTMLRFGDLSAGVYLLRISNQNGNISRKLIIE